jgi:threonine aldolase
VGIFSLTDIPYFSGMTTIDLRSDTVTRPTPAMLAAMQNAATGDDVFGEDPTVNELEAFVAAYFGMEAALFCPSGTMTNQIAIKCHTLPGDEVICESLSHVYIYEGGGIAFNSGSQVKPIDGDRGRITAEQILPAINPVFDYKARTSLVCLENTCNRGGGACYDLLAIEKISELCHKNSLKLHLDGARIWNAIVKNGENPCWYGQQFNSISVCLSKGLGAPAGSLLLGNSHLIKQARRIRKVMGGGMRQAGYLAAAGLFAIKEHLPLLAQDHLHAQAIANALADCAFVAYIQPVETNIIVFGVAAFTTAQAIADQLARHQVLCFAISATEVRMVTHLDISAQQVEQLIAIIKQLKITGLCI